MGAYDLPDMYALSPQACGYGFRHTYQANPLCPCYNYYSHYCISIVIYDPIILIWCCSWYNNYWYWKTYVYNNKYNFTHHRYMHASYWSRLQGWFSIHVCDIAYPSQVLKRHVIVVRCLCKILPQRVDKYWCLHIVPKQKQSGKSSVKERWQIYSRPMETLI